MYTLTSEQFTCTIGTGGPPQPVQPFRSQGSVLADVWVDMGVIEMKEDPTGEANKQPNTPNLLNWRRSDKQKEAKSGNGQHKKTVQAATPVPVSLPALDRNKNAKKRHDKGTAKEEGKTKQHKRDENKKNQDTHKKKDTVEGGEQMSQSSASESTSESSCSTEGKRIQEGPVEDEYDDSDALDPPPSPAPIVDEPERVKVMYTAVCLHTGTVPSQRYIREVWRQRVVVCHQGLDHRQGKAIAVSLKRNYTVRELYLRDNKLGANGFEYLFNGLILNNTLRLLDVSQNDLGTEGAELLAALITRETPLECILSAGNCFGDMAAKFLGEALKSNDRLLELDLSCNLFEIGSGKSLAEGLAQNMNLKWLDLSYNHFRHAGLLALLTGLKNTGLRSLSLAWSCLDSRHVIALGKSLRDNCCLLSLDLSGCRLNSAAILKLLTTLQGNTSLKTLNVSDNPFPICENIKLLSKLKLMDSLAIENVYMTNIKSDSELEDMIHNLREAKPTFTLNFRNDDRGDEVLMRRMTRGLVRHRSDPLLLLLDHVHAKNTDIAGLLLSCSSLDNQKVVKRHAFVRGLMDFGINLTMEQVNSVIAMFDPEADWEIEIDHVVDFCQRYRQKTWWEIEEEEAQLQQMVRPSEDKNVKSDHDEQDVM